MEYRQHVQLVYAVSWWTGGEWKKRLIILIAKESDESAGEEATKNDDTNPTITINAATEVNNDMDRIDKTITATFNNVKKVSEDHWKLKGWKNKIKIQKREPADEDERKGGVRKPSNRMETTSPIPTKLKPVQSSRRVWCKLKPG